MLVKPEYFRAAVMGLKGNIKEKWLIEKFTKLGLKTKEPTEPYSKFDCIIENNNNKHRVQIKGTSSHMCSLSKNKIGFEIMGTHGKFPTRGYKKNMIDYVAVVISEEQLPNNYPKEGGLSFLIIPVSDLPLHYKINKGTLFNEPLWNHQFYSNVIYPNIKLTFKVDENKE